VVEARLSLIAERELPAELRALVFEIYARSETPLFKFFERLPRDISADRLERHRFLLSGPTEAFRNLIRENFDLKFAKGLLVFLSAWEPSLVSDLRPKHRLIPPQDLVFGVLTPEDVGGLSPALKARHLYLGLEYRGPESLALEVLRSRLPFIMEGSPGENRRIFLSASLADSLIYLLKPLEALEAFREDVTNILKELKKRYPDCFGEGG